jgi:hypothetical protein
MNRPDPADGVGRPGPWRLDPRRRVHPRDFPLYAIFAGALTWFANGHLPPGESITLGLAATAFWLVLGKVLFRPRSGPMPAGKPDPSDPQP